MWVALVVLQSALWSSSRKTCHKQNDWQRVNFSLGRLKLIGEGNSLISALPSFMLHRHQTDLHFSLD